MKRTKKSKPKWVIPDDLASDLKVLADKGQKPAVKPPKPRSPTPDVLRRQARDKALKELKGLGWTNRDLSIAFDMAANYVYTLLRKMESGSQVGGSKDGETVKDGIEEATGETKGSGGDVGSLAQSNPSTVA